MAAIIDVFPTSVGVNRLIGRYRIIWNNEYWISFGDWLAEPRYSAGYEAEEKLVIRQTGDSLIAALDDRQFVARDNLYTIVPNRADMTLRVLLGLLNSTFLTWFYQNVVNPEKGEALAQVKRGHLASLPLPSIAKVSQECLASLVDSMLTLNKRLAAEQLPQRREQIQREIDATDRQIDQLVYQLYGLTDEEIRIVEEATR